MKKQRTPEFDAFENLVRAGETIAALAYRGLKEVGLTSSRFGVLAALHESGPLSPKVLAVRILRSPGNLTLVLENLERDGFVKRSPDPKDRRQIIVTLSDTGRKLVTRIQPVHGKQVKETMGLLTERELDTLAKLCRKLAPVRA